MGKMKMRKLARLAGMLILGWAVTGIMKLFTAAVVTSTVVGILYLAGAVLRVRLPYRTIAVLTALVVLAVLAVLDVIRNYRRKRRTR
jgi:cell division protein FtsW (lipid II flippase)